MNETIELASKSGAYIFRQHTKSEDGEIMASEDDILFAPHQLQSFADEIAKPYIAHIERLRESLRECAEDMEDLAQYAGEYFKEKHDLAGDVEKYKQALYETPAQSLAAIRNEVREECAKVCEEGYTSDTRYMDDLESGCNMAHRDCAEAIRSMKEVE